MRNIKKTDRKSPELSGRKARAEGKLKCKSGISVRSDISFALEKESSSYFPFLQMMLAVFSSISVIFMLQSFFVNKNYDYPLVNADSVCMNVIMTALSCLMISKGKAFFKMAGIAYLLLNLFYILTSIKSAGMGLMFTANAYSRAAELPYQLFTSDIATFTSDDLGAFLITFAFVVTLLSSVACIFFVNFPILFLVTFPIFELGAYHGWMPAIWTVVVMVVCWVTTLSISLINHTARKTSKSNFAVSLKKKSFYLTSTDIKQKFFGTQAISVITACSCAFCAALVFYAVKGNYRPDSFQELRRNITRRFGEVTTDIANGNLSAPKVPGRSSMVGGTNGGQWLGSIGKIEFTGKVALKISYDEFTRPLYIRGYAGSEYGRHSSGENKWDPIRADYDMINAFAESGKYILDYNNIQTRNNPDVTQPEETVMRIASVNADPIAFYAPYCSGYADNELIDDVDQYYDGMISPKSQRQTYNVNICAPTDNLSWDALLYNLDTCSSYGYYTRDYEFYSDMVTANTDYLQVPEELKGLLDDIIKKAGISYNDDSLAEKKYKLRRYFDEAGFVYSTEPGDTPKEEDFIKYFLEGKNGKKGFCGHYASSAVMLMRELGYPARYVEGYLVEPTQYAGDKKWMTITDRCAHAWCEVFIQGYGWYPIELTPGYEGNDNPNLTDHDKNLDNQDDPDESESESDSGSSKSGDSSSKEKKPKNDSSSKKADTDVTSSQNVVPVHVKNPNGGNGGGNDPETTTTPVKVTYFFLMTLFIVGFAAAIVVRRKHLLTEMDQSINNSSGSKAVISCYTTLLKYISLLGIKNDTTLTDVQLSSKITTQLGVMSPELNSIFVEISAPAITAYMSGEESDEATAERSRKLLDTARRNVFGRLNFFGRLSARWISGLY